MLAIVLIIKIGIMELSIDTRISVNFYSFSRFYEADVKLIINTLFEHGLCITCIYRLVVFKNSNMKNVQLKNSNISWAKFQNAVLNDVNISNSVIEKNKFQNSKFCKFQKDVTMGLLSAISGYATPHQRPQNRPCISPIAFRLVPV